MLLVDDHVLFRGGIRSLLASRPDVEIVGEAGNGREALERARELMPDLILMDINMPVCDGLMATRLIKNEMPYVKIVILTVSDDDKNLFESIKSGAQGYLLKIMEPDDFIDMLHGVFRGEAPLSRSMAARILNEYARQSRGAGEAPEQRPGGELTPREREVLQLIVKGTTNKEIADRLHISENTVKNHLRNILEKLHLQNRVQAATYAIQRGLVDPLSTT